MTGLITHENHRLDDRPWHLLGVVFFLFKVARPQPPASAIR